MHQRSDIPNARYDLSIDNERTPPKRQDLVFPGKEAILYSRNPRSLVVLIRLPGPMNTLP